MKRIMLGLFVALILAAVPLSPTILPDRSSQTTLSRLSLASTDVWAADSCANGVKLSVKINATDDDCLQGDDIIIQYVKLILKFLSAGVGIIVILMIVVAGIQYITANGQPANVAKAKERIKNAITALILFAASVAILSFLLPGSIFK